MILGISGTFSSGKDTLARHLEQKFGFMNISTGEIVREFARAERGSIERPVLQEVANDLRHKYGGSILVERALDRYHNSIRNFSGVAITGIRSLGEAKAIKELGGTLVYIDAPVAIRYLRMKARQRDGETNISLEEFIARENAEKSSGITDADFNLEQISKLADIQLTNSDNPQEFLNEAEKALSLA